MKLKYVIIALAAILLIGAVWVDTAAHSPLSSLVEAHNGLR